MRSKWSEYDTKYDIDYKDTYIALIDFSFVQGVDIYRRWSAPLAGTTFVHNIVHV